MNKRGCGYLRAVGALVLGLSACATSAEREAGMLMIRGQCLSSMHDLPAATAAFDAYLAKVRETTSESSPARLNAEILVAMRTSTDLGLHEEGVRRARAAIQQFRGSDGDRAPAYRGLAVLEMLAGHRQAAVEAFSHAPAAAGGAGTTATSALTMAFVPNGGQVVRIMQGTREAGDFQLRLAVGDLDGLRRDLEPRADLNVMSLKILFKAEALAGQRERALEALERAAEGSVFSAGVLLRAGSSQVTLGDELLGMSVESHVLWTATSEGWPEQARRLALWTVEERKGRTFEALEYAPYLDEGANAQALDAIRLLRARHAEHYLQSFDSADSSAEAVCSRWPMAQARDEQLGSAEQKFRRPSVDPGHPFLTSSVFAPPLEGYPRGSATAFLARLQARLPDGAVLVSYARFHSAAPDPLRNPDQDPGATPKYVALVVTRGSLRVVDLGDAREIDRRIAAALELTGGAGTTPAAPEAVTGAWGDLFDAVWKPLLAETAHAEQVFVSPDADLESVPFGALYDRAASRWLYETQTVARLASARDLLTGPATGGAKPAGPPMVFADPLIPSHPPIPGFPTLAPLSGAAQEGRFVRDQLPPGALLLEGADADKLALLEARSPLVLHIAGHGLTLPSPGGEEGGASTQRGIQVIRSPGAPRPRTDEISLLYSSGTSPVDPAERWMRAMLVLAPPRTPGLVRDGYTTAYEIMAMDLRGTQLVVLSACSTATGEAIGRQGVSSLQRAFLNAGAETVVATLWPVADESAALWMGAFYKALRQGAPRAAAVKAAIDATRRTYPNPYHWAPFVLMGATGPMNLGESMDAAARRW